MGTVYYASSWETPSNSSYSARKWRVAIETTVTSTATSTSVTIKLYFRGKDRSYGEVGKYVSGNIKIAGSTVKSFSKGDQSWRYSGDKDGNKQVLTITKNYSRTTESQSIKISGTIKVNSSSAYYNGNSSTVSTTVNIPALQTFKITFNGNGATSPSGSDGALETQTYYYNKTTFATYGLPNYTGGTWNLTKTGYNATKYWVNANNSNKRIHEDATYSTTQAFYKAITGTDWNGSGNATDLILKAEWSPIEIQPSITVDVYRVAASGDPVPNPSGTFGCIKITKAVYGQYISTVGTQLTVQITCGNSRTITLANNTTFPHYEYIDGLQITNGYDISFVITSDVTKNNNPLTSTLSKKISPVKFPIDLQVSGNNVYMGLMHTAESNKLLTTSDLYVDGPLKLVQGRDRNDSGEVGYVVSSSATGQTIFYDSANASFQPITSPVLTLDPGSWLVIYSVYVDFDATGKTLATRLASYSGNTVNTVYDVSRMSQQTSTTAHIVNFGCAAVKLTQSRTLKIQAFQNSKSGQTGNSFIQAMRIA